jgi:hypothetical protein
MDTWQLALEDVGPAGQRQGWQVPHHSQNARFKSDAGPIMTITAASNPETVGLDPAALKRLVAAIQADIDQLQRLSDPALAACVD